MTDDQTPVRDAATGSDWFLPSPDTVTSALAGLARVHGASLHVSLDPAHVLAASPDPARRVALVSGGGSGHEPLHTGFVGRGGLDAAVPGQVFASPHNRQVHAAARAAAKPGGVLLVVKNYTGDVINFGIAAERLRAEGVEVDTVLVDDDLATEVEGSATGRRGTGATVLVEKVLGAAADRGASLAELADLGRRVVAASRSLAVATRAHTVPGGTGPAFELSEDELEHGVGIHGERAVSTVERRPAAEVVDRVLEQLLEHVPAGEEGCAVLVNGLGAATGLELHAVLDRVVRGLGERGARVAAAFAGTYVAALDMRGFSVTLTALEPGWLELLRAPTATALPVAEPLGAEPASPAGDVERSGAGENAFVTGLEALVARLHGALTRLDRVGGDGDFGDNLASGVHAASRRAPGDGVVAGLRAAEDAFLDDVGGSSGPLFGLVLQQVRTAFEAGDPGADALRSGLREAAAAVTRVGGAQPGDRTMLDALVAGAEAGGALADVVRAAADGADATAGMTPRRGRASYVGERAVGTPDAGAVGLALVLAALADAVEPAGDLAGELAGRWG
ncbi:dihydroxyacetone kinase subunit DhaK [Paenibacillus sp. TRM 82003]|uniref:dihydroxyacetone kinase subunit DhaK n=1 Tax=Kineococcus sp. TRM81007 TaxID=2925831 RepID=UPI001F568883|nr:dihydroxyacetone kinase subunit DhaK [Kineococcus sp. TRM81007]MCI2237441.1 dihydroxyacetone kinase subunit DhaK [Kineococcus sp. TRM81007]MCI3920651.1 dihydroxyacetone kinase subunit DhaK [Paenibacillus sp. TRM 82003]